jgi:U3 small nucleolar ribonucleoprotein component
MSNKRKFNQEKPEECIICTEKLDDESSLSCGHWVHLHCVQKQFKAECPICRHPLDIVVTGTLPQPYMPEPIFIRRGLILGDVVEHFFETDLPDLEDENDSNHEEENESNHEEDESNHEEDESNHEEDEEDEEDESNHEEDDESNHEDEENDSEHECACEECEESSWRKKGFTHREEDDEYDEENPYGDEVTYEDV